MQTVSGFFGFSKTFVFCTLTILRDLESTAPLKYGDAKGSSMIDYAAFYNIIELMLSPLWLFCLYGNNRLTNR